MTEVPTITLNDGNKMPLLGLGVFQIPDHEKARQTVEMALANGYRMIDTAEVYENQIAVGEAIAESAVNRDDIFLTTKIWVSNMSFEKATKAIDHDLKELGTDYLDLVLLHQPYGDTFGAWNALAAAKRAGKVRSIGLSNFYPDQYMNLELAHEDKPAINQIEINPWFQQTNDVKFFQGRDVAVEAWAQFAEGKHDIFNNKTLKEIAEAHHKTTAQVILRWLTQQDIVVIPKSVHEKRQKENLDIFDFELTKDEMDKIKGLDKGESQFFDYRDPAVIDDIFGESLKQLRDSE
ncbi:oxidoreductase, aldo keto reductase family [Lactobacillus taiwanensis DSM 21401]|nr:aldo/keto reductase [Lactobacillus taiwanensis]KRM97933.1 oxidoreductase, aldo keto reductase family [Lactobacillus taiwanensis DSM 21401]OYR88667.1 aldo/keto reductase [Lactobacillus taiwanensis]OYR89485.1 aldo/keto reductase [Lactobacillus taiwanensis]OYR91951.1 aldo/keto reductase [Lactobacillus taiwanensis]OYR96924.1 aldo/keto reductase [Lactobacillus taiwanensis]